MHSSVLQSRVMVGKSSTVFMIISLETCFSGNSTFTVVYICGKSIANASKQYKEIDHECHGSKSVYSHRFVLFLY